MVSKREKNMEEGGANPVPCSAYMLRWIEGKASLVLRYRHIVTGDGGGAPHQQMDKPRRRMRAMHQMHQQLVGAWKCQVSAANHAVAAIHTILCELGCTHKAWWSRLTTGFRVRGGGGQDRWANDSSLYQTAQEETPWLYVFRQVG